ncbi:MAG: 3-deoxy-8-phosphooctulonate synthase [bacterium]
MIDRIAAGEFFLIAGPCVIESGELCLQVAETVLELAAKYSLPYVFKSSFTKANRTDASSPTGPGLEEGLRILSLVKQRLGTPILTDIHQSGDVPAVAEVADIIQIPAFLCRQTELIRAAGRTGRWVNLKKGQFMAPEDMARAAAKAESNKVMLTERGACFGYHNLVVDFRSFLIMKESGRPVVFDATHSLQRPSAGDGVSTGQPEYVIPLARAATAAGVDGLFVETHPKPKTALSDAGAMLPLAQMDDLLDQVSRVCRALYESQK